MTGLTAETRASIVEVVGRMEAAAVDPLATEADRAFWRAVLAEPYRPVRLIINNDIG